MPNIVRHTGALWMRWREQSPKSSTSTRCFLLSQGIYFLSRSAPTAPPSPHTRKSCYFCFDHPKSPIHISAHVLVLSSLEGGGSGMFVFTSSVGLFLFHQHPDQGIMPYRRLNPEKLSQWRDLANVFDKLLGGTESSRQASAYLRALADGRLSADDPPPLTWHDAPSTIQVMPQAREEPHAVVLATLCPSVALRAVWRRQQRWLYILHSNMYECPRFKWHLL